MVDVLPRTFRFSTKTVRDFPAITTKNTGICIKYEVIAPLQITQKSIPAYKTLKKTSIDIGQFSPIFRFFLFALQTF